jgi:hypothetical protein
MMGGGSSSSRSGGHAELGEVGDPLVEDDVLASQSGDVGRRMWSRCDLASASMAPPKIWSDGFHATVVLLRFSSNPTPSSTLVMS